MRGRVNAARLPICSGRSIWVVRWLSSALFIVALAASVTAFASSSGVLWGTPDTVIQGKGALYSSAWLTRGAFITGGSFVYEPGGPKRAGVSMSVQAPRGRIVWWPGTLPGVANAAAVAVPMWMPLLVTSGLAACLWWPHLRRTISLRQHRCSACGYSRDGLASRVCPECGVSHPSSS